MANGDTPPVSLIDRQGLDLEDEDLQAVEVEALPGDIATRFEIEGIEIIQEDDGGAHHRHEHGEPPRHPGRR